MRVPLSWLCDFAPFPGDAADLAATLDDLGLVVEAVERVGEGLGDVVVARVESIDPIEGADRIRLVTVDDGSGGGLEVVCGAWNFAVGDLVPLAPVGAVLPTMTIARRKVRGAVSNGMLCSSAELALADDAEGIMVLGDTAGGPAPGTPLVEALGIEPDVVFDIAVEANRPDAWSVAGVARDLAARLRLPFALPEPPAAPTGGGPAAAAATVVVVDPDLCPRFTARVLTGVAVGPSPAWVARRLALAGMRPINNVVDASNYVMLELGQPTHPYDLDRLPGAGLRVRAAAPGEQVTTLDGVTRTLGARPVGPGDDRRDCVICDATDTPVGIGGIMGGSSSEIDAATTRVLLEAAYFTPMAVARTAKRLALRTEASARFERGCDPEGIDRAALRLVDVLAATAGGSFTAADGVVDVRGDVPRPARVILRPARLNAVLGTDLDAATITGYLGPIGFATTPAGDDRLEVTVPTFRPDTTREIDVVEEVARHHGYSALPRRRPQPPQVGTLTRYQRRRRLVRQVVADLGADEAWTTSLLGPHDHARAGLGPDGVTVANPLTPDEAVLRRSLLPGLLKALAFNAARRQDDLALFEVGAVFPPPGPDRVAAALRKEATVVDERELLSVAWYRTGDDARTATAGWLALREALGLDQVVLEPPAGEDRVPGVHPTRFARLTGAGRRLGVVGEVDPDVAAAFGLDAVRRVGWLELDLRAALDPALGRSPLVRAVSPFPSSDIDLAFVVDDAVPAGAVAATLRAAAGERLERLELFDVYRGEAAGPGRRSLAFALRLAAADHTLSGDEIAAVRRACIEAVEAAHGARLRG